MKRGVLLVLLASLTDAPRAAALPEAPSQPTESLAARLAAAALEQVAHPVVYDRSYRRRRAEIAPSAEPADYRVGDLVTWMLPGNPPHIGIVVDRRSSDSRRPLLVHNIGNGPEVEDILFRFTTTGHYRYLPASGE